MRLPRLKRRLNEALVYGLTDLNAGPIETHVKRHDFIGRINTYRLYFVGNVIHHWKAHYILFQVYSVKVYADR